MYHLVDNLTNKSGDALVGYYVKLKDSEGAYATLYSDASSTPIATVSGVADAGLTDASGMYDIYVADGDYDIEVFDKNDITLLVSRIPAIPMYGLQSSTDLADAVTAAETAQAAAEASVGAVQADLASTATGKGVDLVAGAFAVVRVTDYGVATTATAAENLAAFKLAYAACPVGGRLWLPPASTPYPIDYSGGYSNAVTIAKRIEIVIDGDLQASGAAAVEVNPNFIFNITAAGVTVSGCGRIIGDGTIDDSNTGTAETFPGLIRVAANDFTLDGVEIVSPPKCGILLYQCYRARIGGRFTGGVTEYGGDSGTGYYGAYAAGGGGHRFVKPRFYPDASSGMFVQCIFYDSSDDNLVEGAYAKHPYEKLIYGTGNNNRDVDCTVEGNPGFIPGTNIQGTITDVIRQDGADNKSTNLTATDVAAGVQSRLGAGNEVIGAKVLRCGQSGVSMNTADLSGAKVAGCTLTKGALLGSVAGDGIRLAANALSRELGVADNRVEGFSVTDAIANLATWAAATEYPNISLVKPTVGNGRYYKKSGGGTQTSGATEPTWPTTEDDTVDDNGITWTCVAYEGGQAEIRAIGASGKEITESSFINNKTSGGQYGIKTDYVTYSKIGGNKVNATSQALIEDNGGYNYWENNDVLGGSASTVTGMAATSTLASIVGDGTATYDPASLADGAGVTTTVALTGAALGNFASASFSLDLQGVALTAWVSAADTVSVRFQNETGGVVDLGSGTIRVRAHRA